MNDLNLKTGKNLTAADDENKFLTIEMLEAAQPEE